MDAVFSSEPAVRGHRSLCLPLIRSFLQQSHCIVTSLNDIIDLNIKLPVKVNTQSDLKYCCLKWAGAWVGGCS